MQFQVPQFIETEDKVVGPFSIRQFMYVGGGALISAMLYFLVNTWLFVILAIVFIGGALAISFVKVEGRSLAAVIKSAFNFYWKPQTYVWQPDYNPIQEHRAVKPKSGGVATDDIASAIASRTQWEKEVATKAAEEKSGDEEPSTLSKILSGGGALHDAWRNVLTGSPTQKTSDKQFLEQKMEQRYHIFQKIGGDREAARRVDYR